MSVVLTGKLRYRRLVPKSHELARGTLANLYNQPPTWLQLAHQVFDAVAFAIYAWSTTCPTNKSSRCSPPWTASANPRELPHQDCPDYSSVSLAPCNPATGREFLPHDGANAS